MARQIIERPITLDQFPMAPETTPERVPLMQPPNGQHADLDYHLIAPSQLKYATNVTINKGVYQVRNGTSVLGLAAPSTMLYAINFILSDKSSYFFRFLLTKVQIYNGVAWADVTGISGLTATTVDLISCAAWNDLLIFSNGKDGTYVIDPVAGSGAIIAGAPIARHLTVTGKRLVIAGSPSNPNTLYWSIRGDYTDFAGLGSGNEDFLATPGGVIDSLTGVYPITDTLSFVVRSGSIWSMVETGNFDAPFQFTKSIPDVGSESPLGVVAIPGGAIVPSIDDVYLVTIDGGARSIAGNNLHYMLDGCTNARRMYGVWNRSLKQYTLYVPSTTFRRVHVCHSPVKGNGAWTSLEYPFDIFAIGNGRIETGILTDDLVGSTDDLIGQTDALGVFVGPPGLLFVPTGSTSFVIVDDPSQNNNTSGRDVSALGVRTLGGFSLETGMITSASPFDKVTINDAQMIAKASRGTTCTMEFSDDGGDSWTQQRDLGLLVTTSSKVYRGTSYLERDSLVGRVRSSDCGGLDIVIVSIAAIKGGMIKP